MTKDKKQFVCDVAIVGGGLSGMLAAVRLTRGGKKVMVFEKNPDDRYICNSRLTAGIWHCAQADILSKPDFLEERIAIATGGAARPDLARAVATDGIRAVRFMQEVGIRFIKGPMDYQSFMLSPPTITPQGRQWEGRGGDVMLRTFEADMNERGGQLHRGYAVTHLIESGDQVVGLEGQMHSGEFFQVKANSVVIADGGFQANPDLIKGPITQSPDRVFQRNAKTGMGEGMRMAQKVGAKLSDLRGFYGHVLSKDAFTNDKLWPYGWLDFVLAAGIVVGKKGDRLFDEGLGGVEAANAIAALSDPLDAIVIADENIWNDAGTFNILPPNPRMVDAGGTLIKANSIEELAQLAVIDPANLAIIISNYNQAIQNNQTKNLLPTRSVEKFKAVPIQKAPFYAIPVCAGITYTMGGICIDADARVLNDQELPIRGLYAVGCASGGLEGGVKKGYVGGLVKSSVTGLRAAEHILGQARVS